MIALGTIDSNDAFTIDEVAFVPEPGPEATTATFVVLAMLAFAARRPRGSFLTAR